VNAFVLLAMAILSEVVATLSLRSSDGFTKPLPSVLVVLGYGVAFYLLSHVLKELTVGTVYAIWSGVGTAVVAVAGALLFGDRLNPTAGAGILLIVAGVVVLNVSGVASH
jgi:small multidrug resistance pump